MNKRLNRLSDRLVISRKSDERKSIKGSLLDLEVKLKSHLKNDVLKTVRFGSWIRNTLLPREYDPKSDVDLLVLFKTEENSTPIPGEYRSKLKKFAEEHYPNSIVQKDNPAVTLDHSKMTYEMVPAINESSDSNCYDIPNPSNKDEWIQTQPKELKLKLKKANQPTNGLVSRIIRLCKYWNSDYGLSSYKLERIIVELDFKQIEEGIYSGFLLSMNAIIQNEIREVIKKIEELEEEKKDSDNEQDFEKIEKQIEGENSKLKKHESIQDSLKKIEQYRDNKKHTQELEEMRKLLPEL